jgi:hypothetical protein
MKFNERMTPKQSIIFVITIAIVVFITMQFTHGQGDGWSEWVDPDNHFNLQYPSDPQLSKGWFAIPRENKSEDQDVIFAIDRNGSNFRIDVYNTTSPAADLGTIMNRSAEGNTNNPKILSGTSKLFAGPDYTSFTVSGKRAGSVIWVSQDPFNDKTVELHIVSIVGDKYVYIIYVSSPENFDKHLPIVKRVIQSIKIK